MVKNPQTTLTMDKELEMRINDWIDKHKLAWTAICTTMDATIMAGGCGTMQFIKAHVASAMSLHPWQGIQGACMVHVFSVDRGGPWEQGRNMAIVGAAHICLCGVIRTARGKEDVKEGLVAGFGAGYVGAMVSGMKGIRAISNAIFFSLAFGIATKIKMNNLRKKEEDLMYNNTRCMLSTLGLEQFEKNFKRGLFTDRNLPLLTNSDLQEVDIPAGARRAILKHIQKNEFIRKVADVGQK